VVGEQDDEVPLDPEIRKRVEQMAADFMPQVRAEAWKVYQRAPHALELDELTALGLLGLAQAVNKWPAYCKKNGYSPAATEFLIAYILRRVKGAMLDALRSQDWVTRSVRTRAKVLRDSGQDLGLDEAELARRAGLTVEEVRGTVAAVAARPVSLDAEPHDVAAQDGTESQAVVSSVLEQAAGVVAACPPAAQAVVVLRYYYGKSPAEAAEIAGIPEEEAVRILRETVLAVHSAMVKAVS
jgi:RNA polymerase sigma factor for flagellar operon FliA